MTRVVIIAEAGVNHNGSLEMALQLVDVAAEAGADIVKFQTFNAAKLATSSARKAEYQQAGSPGDTSQLEMLKRLELSESDHHALVARCVERGIQFMSTAFDIDSLRLLSTLDMPAIKVPSGDITCGPLLLEAARLRRPLIISTGMATLDEIDDALRVVAFGLTQEGDPASTEELERAYRSSVGRQALERLVTLLHCTTAYPASPHSVNLRSMDAMASAFGLPVGYSDHTTGIDIAIAAVARGAVVVEKHFTLDRTLPGPDHAASLEPAEFAKLVEGIRRVEAALGSATKGPTAEELGNLPVARRSVVAARPIQRGEAFAPDMLTTKRPGTGLSPMHIWALLGQAATRDYQADEPIER